MDVGGYFRSLTDVSGYLISVKFSGIVKLIKFSGFLKYKIDINRNIRLNKFSKFQFRVKVVHYKAFLLATRGSK